MGEYFSGRNTVYVFVRNNMTDVFDRKNIANSKNVNSGKIL
jgi:hypothetical protein